MKFVLQIFGCWTAFSCVAIPGLTWAFFRPARNGRAERAKRVLEQQLVRKARHDEATAHLTAWLTSTNLKPPN
jgi:hypothetical protein